MVSIPSNHLGIYDLFCSPSVRALFDYQAMADDEFDFHERDVIAVTATPEDGRWSGVLLHEDIREPGRYVFP